MQRLCDSLGSRSSSSSEAASGYSQRVPLPVSAPLPFTEGSLHARCLLCRSSPCPAVPPLGTLELSHWVARKQAQSAPLPRLPGYSGVKHPHTSALAPRAIVFIYICLWSEVVTDRGCVTLTFPDTQLLPPQGPIFCVAAR